MKRKFYYSFQKELINHLLIMVYPMGGQGYVKEHIKKIIRIMSIVKKRRSRGN